MTGGPSWSLRIWMRTGIEQFGLGGDHFIYERQLCMRKARTAMAIWQFELLLIPRERVISE